MEVSVIWLIIGAVFLALEAFQFPGIGLLFAGLGALVAGAAVESGLVGDDAHVVQGAVFLIATSVFAALLWKKLKAWRLNPNTPTYSNIIGTEATVVGTLKAGKVGQVRWSGTLMRAKLSDGTVAELPEGAIVTVAAVEGNVLTVAPKN